MERGFGPVKRPPAGLKLLAYGREGPRRGPFLPRCPVLSTRICRSGWSGADVFLWPNHTDPVFERSGEQAVQVSVRDNNVDQALRALKKKLQREGVFREMKLRRSYEKPSAKKKRERAEAVRRYRKLLRKRMEREGY